MINIKSVGDYLLIKCTAVAVTAGDCENQRQDAILLCDKRINTSYAYSVLYGYSFDDIESIADLEMVDPYAVSLNEDDLSSVIIGGATLSQIKFY